MQSIPVDVSRLGTMMCVVAPEPKLVNQETGEVKKDRDGTVVWTVGVSVRQQGRRATSVIEIAVPGEPKGITEGTRLHVADLVAFSWAMGDRHGMSFRASAITPATDPTPQRPAAKGGEGA